MSETNEQPKDPSNPNGYPESYRSPTSGCFPPGPEHQFKKGNDARRNKKAPRGLSGWLNTFFLYKYSALRLKRIANNARSSAAKRGAAIQALRMLENPDLADVEPVLKGEKTLSELRSEGFPTETIKKIRVKSRKVKVADGEFEEVIEREVELHDRAGTSFDRVADRTEGKPTQKTETKTEVTIVQPNAPSDAFLRRCNANPANSEAGSN